MHYLVPKLMSLFINMLRAASIAYWLEKIDNFAYWLEKALVIFTFTPVLFASNVI